MTLYLGVFIVVWCWTAVVLDSYAGERGDYAIVFWSTVFAIGMTLIISNFY